MTAFYPLEYLTILKRKKFIFITVFSLVFLLGAFFSMGWSKYQAFATIEVARPEISIDALESYQGGANAAESLADLQISRLRQQVLSTSSLAEVIAKLNLYPQARKHTPITRIAKNMRQNIDIKLVSTALANPASAQKVSATQLSAIAFTISFEYNDPALAQKAVNELVSRFLDEDLKERRQMAEKTSDFLDGQIEIVRKSLEDQETKIAEFRSENGDLRPDALAFNQQASITTTSRLMSVETDLTSNLGRIGALQAQLAQTEPYLSVIDHENGELVVPPSVQLRALESQYAALKAKYSENHPDVKNVARQIETLRKQVRNGDKKTPVRDADNPSYLQIMAQLDAARKQQEALEAQRDAIKEQQANYQEAINANPEAEQKLAALARDYDNLSVLYRELKAKKLAADMNKTIEDGHAGQRLAVIDPPELPLSTSPSRKLLLVISFILAGTAATGTVLALYLLSPTVVGSHHLESLLGVAPLVRIPNLKTFDEKITLKRRLMILAAIALVIIGGLMALYILSLPISFIQSVMG